jgi:hypothetical protein
MTRGLFLYSRRIALSDLATGLSAGAGMYALTVALARVHLPAIDVENDGVATVAQVIPATIVAVFVFILGLGFLMAQLVAPARGSRAVTKLHESRRLARS